MVKIAVKRGIQNTNNKLMAEEIQVSAPSMCLDRFIAVFIYYLLYDFCFAWQSLTGGVLLLRNKFYIVIYRGKDFLPTSVAAALAERQELTKEIQDVEEKVRMHPTDAAPSNADEAHAPAGTLAEFYEAQSRWGREITADEREKMVKDASIANTTRVVRRIEHKLELVSIS